MKTGMLFRRFWAGPAGASHVLRIAIPLIISTSAHTVQMFVDRMFLSWWNTDATGSSLQAGMLHFAMASFFLGIVNYVGTFVAQYKGARRPERVGLSVWQGIFFGFACGLLFMFLMPISGKLFAMIGHSPQQQEMETQYFRILCVGVWALMLNSAVSAYFSGLGRTTLVMAINLFITAVNILLDYLMIFGKWFIPEMGIRGAAWATVFATMLGSAVFIYFFLRKGERDSYGTLTGMRIDRDLFRRLMRFGLPSGINFFLDMICWTLFVSFAGHISKTALNATSLTFNINQFSFMPVVGLGIAVSILVGQYLGADKPRLAKRACVTTAVIGLAFTALTSVCFLTVPGIFLYPFMLRMDAADAEVLMPVVRNLLFFAAAFCMIDAVGIILSSALKGAGDTMYVMASSIISGLVIMVIPSSIAIRHGAGIYTTWMLATAYLFVFAILQFVRYRQGRWTRIRVIETVPREETLITTHNSELPPTI